ncbi:MAG: polyprenol monophosphomannose synthase [Acidobacteriota bacterium]
MDESPDAGLSPQLSLILPTYCEAESLPHLVPEALRYLRDSGFTAEVIVVDDASPDGTAAVARELAALWPLEVIERRDERGLATAVLAGFARARGETVIVMDADGSHPPEALPRLAAAIRDGAEIAVGSRLADGGGFRDWPLWGRFKSRFAAYFARGLTPMSDPTTGLMAARRQLVESLDLDPVGWKIVLEVAVKAAPRTVVEVPIVFGPRLGGESKQSFGVFLQYLRHCLRLYVYRWRSKPTSADRQAPEELG